MSASTDAALGAEESPPVGRLSRLQFWGILAVLLVIFAFSEGAVWWHPWDIALLNGAIWYSYFPIPVLVAMGLVASKKLNLRGWFLDVLSLTLLKYSLTFSFALVLWAVVDTPVFDVAPPRPEAHDAPAESLPVPTVIQDEDKATMSGVVRDKTTREPVAGALVFVSAGLSDYVFAPPSEPVLLQNDGRGVAPILTAAALNQEIRARSTDGHLHTLVATMRGDVLFNIPLIRSGIWNRAVARDAAGEVSLRCTVHQGPETEPEATLLLLSHPFFQTTGPDGRFHFEGVPKGKLTLEARAAQTKASLPVDLKGPSEAIDLDLEAL